MFLLQERFNREFHCRSFTIQMDVSHLYWRADSPELSPVCVSLHCENGAQSNPVGLLWWAIVMNMKWYLIWLTVWIELMCVFQGNALHFVLLEQRSRHVRKKQQFFTRRRSLIWQAYWRWRWTSSKCDAVKLKSLYTAGQDFSLSHHFDLLTAVSQAKIYFSAASVFLWIISDPGPVTDCCSV